jgi:hypothetical protein
VEPGWSLASLMMAATARGGVGDGDVDGDLVPVLLVESLEVERVV